MIVQPTLQFGFMPFVISCDKGQYAGPFVGFPEGQLNIPGLLNQLLAPTSVSVRASTRPVVKENFILTSG